jgi:signal transduction histidine kinase
MALHKDQVHAINGAVWLFGLGALFYTRAWWPGILFLVGISAIVEGLVDGQGWFALQGGAWAIGIGAWALVGFQLWFLFVVLGISLLVGAFVPPPMLAKKARPKYETDLE